MIPKPYNVIHDACMYTVVVCMMNYLYSLTTHWTLINDVLYCYQGVTIIFDSWSKHITVFEAMWPLYMSNMSIIWQVKHKEKWIALLLMRHWLTEFYIILTKEITVLWTLYCILYLGSRHKISYVVWKLFNKLKIVLFHW